MNIEPQHSEVGAKDFSPVQIADMIDIRHACFLTRFLLEFCRSRYSELNGWLYWVEYKELFGRQYFIQAHIF